jgi:acetaldehyde dehydrogenase / alcohol dehydrogenase
MSFSEQGITEDVFNQDMEMISYLAFEDQCTPCNPKLALVKDMQEILKKAYKAV